MTHYVVLQEVPDGKSATFVYVANAEARSAQAALQAVFNAQHEDIQTESGRYVAIPARSFRPVTVKVETKTALRFS